MEPGPAPGPEPDPATGPVPGTDPAADPDVEPLHRGGFRCRLCQITVANLPSLQSHLAGKRHRRLRCLRSERLSQEQRSLFVSGFPRGTDPARLRRHFRAFGDVATVVMDKEKGAFAIVELGDAAGRLRALQEPRHLLGGRRLRVRPREHREFPRERPRDPPGTPPGPPGLLQALGRAQDVGAQLQLLVVALELSAAERRLRELLLALIREVFTEFFPGCSVVPYGSSVNGFDVHGCDLDLHLELGGQDGDPQNQETPNGDPQNRETPNGDPQSPETPNGDPQNQETPNGDPQTQGTPNGDPQNRETPNGDPQNRETPNGDPQSPETPNGDPQNRETPNGDPQSPETPNGDPQNRETPNGDTQNQETPNGDPPPNGSRLGDKDPPLKGSLLGSGGSLLGDRGSHLGSEGSLLGSEGSLLGSRDPSLDGSLLGDEAAPPSGSESEGSLSGGESPEPGGSLLGCGGSLLGRGAPPEQLLALVGAVLRRCVPGVRGVRAVPGARRPVVKFSHKQSGLAGDVCLDNRLALFNTRFLRLCADADPRVRPLGYAVRLWAAGQRLAGNRAGGGPLLTNYALTLLLVLFLQSRSPPVLPSVRRLRHLAGPRDRAQVGGWDCSFPRDAAELEPSGNTQSAASLLAEFFSYFGSLDLGGLLLSPLEGRALPRPPPGTLGGLRPGPLTLQDPFELSHNVAANVTPRTVSRFVRCCRDAARLCRGPEFLQKSRRGRPWGVMRLLQPENPGNSQGKFLIPVPLRAPGVPRSEVCAAVGFVLREVLGCGCEPEGDPGEPEPGAGSHLEGDLGLPGVPGGEEELLPEPGEPEPGAGSHLERVTGDSWGDLGDPGTLGDEGKPPPGTGSHLERVTGDSRGDSGVPGVPGGEEELLPDPSEPEPGAGSRLERVTGDSRGDLGVPGAPGPGWKRRLPEGVADGAGVPPAKRPRGPAVPARWSCCVWYRVWRGRRRLRRRLRLGGPGGAPDPGGAPGPGGVQGPEGPGGAPDPGGAPGPGGVQGPEGPGGAPDPGGAQNPGEFRGSGGAPGPRDFEGPGGFRGPGGVLDPGGAQGPGGAPGPGDFEGPGGFRGPGGVLDPGGAQGPGGAPGPGDFGGPGGSLLALERAVTDAIVRGDTGTPPEPLLRFQLSARPGGSRRDPQILLRLQPDPPSQLFQEFFHFLRSFLPEMVRQRLGWGAGGAETPEGADFGHSEVLQ
ncbi:speckle targeted PIP5K1A-regulated poly(A) polymerase [Poecile atricapillus]|uniref:speckle targeted PIP5K1A-regulated poly(A) polymerase n=1 Tax=Poecile atricapillus TaxID=48891 RepID=UPI00273A49B8|nr:speckle targeted PIP5K1A-regulated poly(A) polymerase [Poecile atricapillus]